MKTIINGLGIEYQDVGKGPSVVMLHEEEAETRYWQEQTIPLVEKGFRVISIRSAESQQVEAIPALMNYLGIGRAVIVGLTAVASQIEDIRNKYAERVAATCLISPSPVTGGVLSRIYFNSKDMPEHVLIGGQDSLAAHMVAHAIPLNKQPVILGACHDAAYSGSSAEVALQLTGFLQQLHALRPRHLRYLNWCDPGLPAAMKAS